MRRLPRALRHREGVPRRRGPFLRGGSEAGARLGLLHAHGVRSAGDRGYGQPERHRWRRALRQAGRGGGRAPHARLRLRAGLRAVRAGAAGGGLRVPRGSALRLLRGLRGRLGARGGVLARSGLPRRGAHRRDGSSASQLEEPVQAGRQAGRRGRCGAGSRRAGRRPGEGAQHADAPGERGGSRRAEEAAGAFRRRAVRRRGGFPRGYAGRLRLGGGGSC